jgi:protein-glutamine gamma-glutamyltransferase
MIFDVLHKRVIYAVVIMGLLPITLSGEIPLPYLFGIWVAILFSYVRQVPMHREEKQRRMWTSVLLGALVICITMGVITGNWLLYAILFALLMIVTRLFLSRSSKDVFQLLGLSFMALIAGAVVNPDITFFLIFIGYTIFGIWALVLLHLQRDMEALAEDSLEEQEEETNWQSTTLIRGRFLLGTSVLAIIVLLFSAAFFFLFPRMGMGFFFGQGRSGKKVSGFSEQLELGHFGTIKDDMDVIMRVEYPEDRMNSSRRVRLRGISFDKYDGKRWSKTNKHLRSLPTLPGGRWAVMHDKRNWDFPEGQTRVLQDIYLEPLNMDRRVIFGEPRMINVAIGNVMLDRLKRDRLRFYQDHGTDVMTKSRQDTAIRYQVISANFNPDVTELREAGTDVPEAIASTYLQLPDTLSTRIRQLAEDITGSQNNNHDKVRAVMRYLRSNYSYTTEGGHDPDDPLQDFLFDRRSGHCEYFASAMTILLRAAGVPARPANGFFGGAYNRYGHYYAIRQADAHSWVEVWYPEFGWLTYDPTPPSMVIVPPEDGFWAGVNAFFDSVKLKWYRWIVEYDLEKQLEVFKGLGRMLNIVPVPDGKVSNPKAWKRGVKKWVNDPNTWIVFASPLLLIFLWRLQVLRNLLAWIFGRRRKANEHPAGRIGNLYTQLLRALDKKGLGRERSETPREYARRLKADGFPGAHELDRITHAFESALYGSEDVEDTEYQRLRRVSRDLRRLRH